MSTATLTARTRPAAPTRRPGVVPLLGALLALYLIVPIAVMVVHLASHASSGLVTTGLWSALGISLLTATIATAVITLFGVPLAWVLARRPTRFWSAVGVAVQLPLALPPLMSGILLVEVVGPYTFVGRLLHGALTDTPGAIVLAQTFVAAPFLVVTARSAFQTVPDELLDVAATLGHSRSSRFTHVALPVAARGIRAGMLLSWLRAFGEFGATVILAYHPYSLPVFTFVRFDSVGLPSALPPTGVAVLAAAVILTLANLRASRLRRWLRRCFATGLRPWTRPAPGPDPARALGAGPTGEPTAGDRRTPLARDPEPLARDPEPLAFELHDRLGSFELNLAYTSQTPRLALLGASGSGKSLALRCLAGLRGNGVGEVRLGQRALGALAPSARRIGLVPQGQSLIPGISVWRQVNFGVGTDPEIAARWIDTLGLTQLVDRVPEQLSGGQRQRVALARALAYEPDLLLLDEPLSALDRPVRDELRRELRRLQWDAGVSTVIVTHDPDEAAMLADDIVVVEAGEALQTGTRAVVFDTPASARVARLLAIDNVRRGRMLPGGMLMADPGTRLAVAGADAHAGHVVLWCIRAEDVVISDVGAGADPDAAPVGQSGGSTYSAQVLDVLEFGGAAELTLRLGGGLDLTARLARGRGLARGAHCRVSLAPESVTVWAVPETSAYES